MDNSYLYFTNAELDYRRELMLRSAGPRRRRGTKVRRWRRHGTETVAGT